MDTIYKAEKHPKSQRTASIEDDGICAWLYLSKRESDEIEKDAWLYNRIDAPRKEELGKYRNQPPPAIIDYIYEPGQMTPKNEKNFRFSWSEDGESVALWLFNELHAFILPEQKRGYSRLLKSSCPWGNPIDFEAYDRHLK